MTDFNPKDTGWATIFHQHGTAVALPEQLTKKWWEKKKGTLAKIKGGIEGGTGITEALEMVADAFRQVTWVNLPGNPTAIEKGVEDCKNLMKSPQLRAFRDKLHDLRDLAREQSKVMAKSMLTKGTAKILEEMAGVADSVWIACNASSLSTSLEVGLRLWGEEQRANAIKNAGPTINAAALVVAKIPNRMQEIESLLEIFQEDPERLVGAKGKEVPARGALGNAIRGLCRDCTQPLGNLMKAHEAGVLFVGFDAEEVSKLSKTMSKISNTRSHSEFMDGLSGPKAATLVKLVSGWTSTFCELIDGVSIGRVPQV